MIRRNTAGQVVTLPQLSLTANGTAVTSSASITVVKDGTSASGGGTLTHITNGVWCYTPSQAETDCLILGLILTATNATPVVLNLVTTAANTQTAAFGANTTTPPTASANASATRTELATELARIDVAISSRQPSGTVNANIVTIGGVAVAVDTNTAGQISFISGAYVATNGNTVNANIVQVGGENITDDGNGRMEVIIESVSGTGARTVTITVNDGTTAIENAKVRVASGLLTYVLLTNSSGVVTFNLDDSTWTVAITKPGYTFAGASLVVDGTETRTYSMTANTIAAPDTPGLCAVLFSVLYCGDPVVGATITASLEDRNPTVDGSLISRAVTSGTTNTEGQATLTLIQYAEFTRGGVYRIKVADSGGKTIHDRLVTIPSQSTANAEDLPDAV